MLQPRNDERTLDAPRTTIPQPKPGPQFAGWGPRLRF